MTTRKSKAPARGDLTDEQRAFVVHCLRVAAEKFKAEAARTREVMTEHNRVALEQVAAGFEAQAEEAERLAVRFEEEVARG